jgi:hypothetical protein
MFQHRKIVMQSSFCQKVIAVGLRSVEVEFVTASEIHEIFVWHIFRKIRELT